MQTGLHAGWHDCMHRGDEGGWKNVIGGGVKDSKRTIWFVTRQPGSHPGAQAGIHGEGKGVNGNGGKIGNGSGIGGRIGDGVGKKIGSGGGGSELIGGNIDCKQDDIQNGIHCGAQSNAGDDNRGGIGGGNAGPIHCGVHNGIHAGAHWIVCSCIVCDGDNGKSGSVRNGGGGADITKHCGKHNGWQVEEQTDGSK